ncbi:MAG: protein-glutamate O-methyltransferase CheR [Firmicutes bacterium]|nr:protein-glutamate O-methyltransferase CheR [Bacillota bacterium]MDH7496663.1 protein-glutamate O-methyltransferase CheR [Bacillota bacterium]
MRLGVPGVAIDVQDMEYGLFRKKVMQAVGIDLGCYKENQMKRRLAAALTRSGHASLFDYWRAMEQDPTLLRDFVDFVTINVSSFFRNREKFDELARTILPDLLKVRRSLKVWSAGCSTGQEPYTIGIVLSELTPGTAHRILGTDINVSALSLAREAVYTRDDVKEVRSGLVQKYFTVEGDKLKLRDSVRRMVEFRIHNLLADAYEEECDLILCRNVMIYFTEEAKERVFRGFHTSLRPGGVLFIGGTETIMNASELGFELVSPFFYRKRPSVVA